MVHYLTSSDIGDQPWSTTGHLVTVGSTGVHHLTFYDRGESPWSTIRFLVTAGSLDGALCDL